MSGSVKPIDRRTVHQICSGQVVLSLAVAVKELVENSLDAGATNIEVRLREHGLELVEVSDNGGGVAEDNFEALTLKHHTSKIRDFSDLEVGVATFGFRGEALSSLCALCDLTVTTRHGSAHVGTRIDYDHDGHIKNRVSCARETGMTVSLNNLFHSLPVRHKEFTRNVKKEFNRMIQLLQGYCLICTGTRIVCSNQVAKSGRQLVLSTSGNITVRENIVNCFGVKQFRQLVEIVQCSVDDLTEEDLSASGLKSEALKLFQVSGYISHCNHGYGRSAADRQFYFFNSRPCDHSKLSKVVNEVYHNYNRHQYPFVVLNVTTAREHVDVNVTPDKRQVMLYQEKALLTLVKLSLTKLFEPLQEQFDASKLDRSQGSLATPSPLHTLTPPLSSPSLARLYRLKRPATDSISDVSCQRKQKQAKLVDFGSVKTNVPDESDVSIVTETESESPLALRSRQDPAVDQSVERVRIDNSPSDHNQPQTGSSSPRYLSSPSTREVLDHLSPEPCLVETRETVSESVGGHNTVETEVERDAHETRKEVLVSPENVATPLTLDRIRTDHEEVDGEERAVASMAVGFDLELVRERLTLMRNGREDMKEKDGDGKIFRAKINPSSNNQAEEELRKQISKADFLKMKILGQFNLGFIVTRLGSDLFIVDQHASDEKYNFERLQRDTVIQHQRLIQPKHLELTAVGENIVMDNLDMFKKNGFQFEIDHQAMPTKRVKLVCQPVSKNWSLGPKDIDELIFMLSDGNCTGDVLRPTSVRAMFASRACRSSVMIGTALSSSDMKKLITHMSEIEQPWCCPHGRPTMRHIVDLSKVDY